MNGSNASALPAEGCGSDHYMDYKFMILTKKSFVNIDRSDNRQNELSGNVSFIYPDAYGHVWVYFPQFGIVVFDAISGRILKKHPASTLGTNEILSFLQFSSRFIAWASNQFLWATDHGFRLLTYDREGNIISSDGQLPINSAFGNKTIFSCAKDPQGNLWFSTFEHLYVWDPRGNTHQMIEDIVQAIERGEIQVVKKF